MENKLETKVGFATLCAMRDLYREAIMTYHNSNMDIPLYILDNAFRLERYLKKAEKELENE